MLGSLLVALVIVAPLEAQAKKEKEKPEKAAAPTSRAILANLQLEVDPIAIGGPIRLSDLLKFTGNSLREGKREVTFAVDDEAFREESTDVSIYDADISFKNLPPKTTLHHLWRQALKQLPIKSAMIVRAGRVDIVPLSRTSKEYMLNQTVRVDFSDRKLDMALEELSELTGVSIVMDPRVKQKAQTTVTARFHDDVALQDAVRMLTEMAELKMVYLVTGMYITTPEHAAAMQKELKAIYDLPAPAPGAGVGGPLPGGLPGFMTPPLESPLAPPLPPSKKRPDAGGAQ
jgi:hypothetical protein